MNNDAPVQTSHVINVVGKSAGVLSLLNARENCAQDPQLNISGGTRHSRVVFL